MDGGFFHLRSSGRQIGFVHQGLRVEESCGAGVSPAVFPGISRGATKKRRRDAGATNCAARFRFSRDLNSGEVSHAKLISSTAQAKTRIAADMLCSLAVEFREASTARRFRFLNWNFHELKILSGNFQF